MYVLICLQEVSSFTSENETTTNGQARPYYVWDPAYGQVPFVSSERAYCIDKYARIGFPVTFAILTSVYWIVYAPDRIIFWWQKLVLYVEIPLWIYLFWKCMDQRQFYIVTCISKRQRFCFRRSTGSYVYARQKIQISVPKKHMFRPRWKPFLYWLVFNCKMMNNVNLLQKQCMNRPFSQSCYRMVWRLATWIELNKISYSLQLVKGQVHRWYIWVFGITRVRIQACTVSQESSRNSAITINLESERIYISLSVLVLILIVFALLGRVPFLI